MRSLDERIFFSDELNEKTCLDLNILLWTKEEEFWRKNLGVAGTGARPYRIELYLNTLGGSLWDTMPIVETIKRSRVKIHTIVDGVCASAGTLIFVVGDKRIIRPTAQFLVHNFGIHMYGSFNTIKDDMIGYEQSEKLMIDHYKEYTKLSRKKIKALMSSESWLTPDEVVEFGFADKKE